MKIFSKDDPEIQERILLSNDLAFAFLNRMPIVPGHSLICPTRPVSFSKDLTQKEWTAICNLQKIICQALKKALYAEGFNFAWNEGEVAGQTVAHFHLHVVPRKPHDAGIWRYEPRVFLYRPSNSRPISPKEELRQVAMILKKEIDAK